MAYAFGDPVWAKMRGFPAWPGKIVDASFIPTKKPARKKSMQCVFFFGTNDCAWISEDNITPYHAGKEKFAKCNVRVPKFQQSLDTAAHYVLQLTRKQSSNLPSIDDGNAATLTQGSALRANAHGCPQEESAIDHTPKGTTPAGKQPKGTKDSLQKKSHKRTSPKSDSPCSAAARKKKKNGNSTAPRGSDEQPNSRPDDEAYSNPPVICDLEAKITDGVQKGSRSNLKFGFLGQAYMGKEIVRNLLRAGHKVAVWNEMDPEGRDFAKAGAVEKPTAAEVVAKCDITFSCVSSSATAKHVVYGSGGVLRAIGHNKGFVQMTAVDKETSGDVSELISREGGRYLEAFLFGSNESAEEGSLIILAAGDRSLFNDCETCFGALGKPSFYLGEVGSASKVILALNMLLGATVAGLAEAMGLCAQAGIEQKYFLEILELSDLRSAIISQKARAMLENVTETPTTPLQHLQEHLQRAITMSEQLGEPLTVTAAVNEQFKIAKALGYGQHDASAVYTQATTRRRTN
ncbi:uncharacterized protein LOC144162324 [Haemaphysalis longicornis]